MSDKEGSALKQRKQGESKKDNKKEDAKEGGKDDTAVEKDGSPSAAKSSSSTPSFKNSEKKKASSSSSSSRRPPGAAGGGRVNPCVVLVLVMMLVGAVYLVWEASVEGDSSLPIAGHSRSIDGGRLVSSLRHWPAAVSNHHSEGLYVPINDGVRDLNVFVRTAGYYTREEEVVLLLTSLPTGSFSFRSVFELLQDKQTGTYLVSFDFPGLGLSDKPQDASYDTDYLAERIKDVIASMGLGKVHLVLQDYAGTVGLRFAERYPHLVRSATLLDPGLELALPQLAFPASLLASADVGTLSAVRFSMLTSSLPVLSHVNRYLWRSVLGDSLSQSDSLAFSFLARYSGGKRSLLRIGAERAKGLEALMANGEARQSAVATLQRLLASADNNQSGIALQCIFSENNRYYANAEEQKQYVLSTLRPGVHHVVQNSGFLVQADQPAQLVLHVVKFVRGLPPSVDKLNNKKANLQAQREAEDVMARLAAGDPSLHVHSHGHDGGGEGQAHSHSHAHGHSHSHGHSHGH